MAPVTAGDWSIARDLGREGWSRPRWVREGALSRLRPVVMPVVTASLALLHAALSHAVGAETARPFAVVIVGGLVTATLLTLFALPPFYPLFEREARLPVGGAGDPVRDRG